MITVNTKEELASAIKNGEKHIQCKGEIAKEIIKKKKLKKYSAIFCACASVACIAAIPFTGGASGIGAVAAGTCGLTVGTTTMTIGELAIICGTGLAGLGILAWVKGSVTVQKDGSVMIEFK